MTTIALVLGLFFAAMAYAVALFWIGMKWVRAESATLPRAFLLLAVSLLVGAGFIGAEAWAATGAGGDSEFFILAYFAATIAALPLLWWLFARIAKTTFWRGAGIWLVQLVGGLALLPAIAFGVKP